tara:strand:- start:1362 stop:1868 length:507 start_codon:yes stop_codon:yes gene_type:complete
MKLTKSQLKQIIKEELEKILQEGGHWVDIKGTDLKVQLYELTNLAEEAREKGVTKLDKQLENGAYITAVKEGDPNYDPNISAADSPGNFVESGQQFIWPSVFGWQFIIDLEGGQMQLPLEEPPDTREMSPSMFDRIRGALGRGDRKQVAELLQKLVKEELRSVLTKKT